MTIVLLICFTLGIFGLEYKVVKHIPFLRRLVTKYPMLGIPITMSLILILGFIFKSHGPVIMVADLLSCFMLYIVYSYWKILDKHGCSHMNVAQFSIHFMKNRLWIKEAIA